MKVKTPFASFHTAEIYLKLAQEEKINQVAVKYDTYFCILNQKNYKKSFLKRQTKQFKKIYKTTARTIGSKNVPALYVKYVKKVIFY